ncbi:beta-ketoacyl synthase [Pseudomonas sp. GCM10022188]|uniref:beta-ketoacyl synthase n=1 Tax=Pseudomonas TaxID=286 RepID=UPI001E415936|nr:beta-ketoacyl synthase [Pseudomonas oryzagri]MCC6077433.1 beta-ketoacyl synthase [Pseudomonas oryzagri]
MTAYQARPVYIADAAVLNAAGEQLLDLHGHAPEAKPLPFDQRHQAHPVKVPRLPGDLFDRKIQRSVEAQGLRLLHCAARLAPALRALELPSERVALTAAIPEVDAPSPCWDAVEAIQREPDRLLPQLFANTPPLHALTLLNSTVMAYVAEALQCNGPMGAYCSQANAGVDALIEAVMQIAENKADAALVVSSSPNLTPALYLRDGDPASGPVRGEGAAALLLTAAPAPGARQMTVRVAGLARGYVADETRAEAVAAQVLAKVLKAERLAPSDVDMLLIAEHDELLAGLLGQPEKRRQSSQGITGDLGASSMLTDIAYALGSPGGGEACRPRYVLAMNRSKGGHFAAVLLATAEMRAEV